MRRLERYWNTVRYLRPVQIYGRVLFRLARPKPDNRARPPLAKIRGALNYPEWRQASQLGPARFRFLGEEKDLPTPADWTDQRHSALWLYNAHYFDDLLASDAQSRSSWHKSLIARWIAENPPTAGIGWAPYPTSLRIVNWIFWLLRSSEPANDAMLRSLAVQTRHLSKRLEHHIQGNHLLANAKALACAGLFFFGEEAEAWYKTGMALLAWEFREQLLADHGHFELSPMYHNIILTDLLDLITIHALAGRSVPAEWPDLARGMLAWAASMTHPDGEIALFNDAAFGIAPNLAQLRAYMNALGLAADDETKDGLTYLAASGYVRMSRGKAVVFADVAAVGPDYLPAHAHADTLSFELSLGQERIIVNGGTSRYGIGPERAQERSTAGHSTLVLDEQDSSEVWGGFRVARRAKIIQAEATQTDREIRLRGAHDGYRRLQGGPIHKRDWVLGDGQLSILDEVTGAGQHRADIFFHLAPGLVAEPSPDGNVTIKNRDGGAVVAQAATGPHDDVAILPSHWHPRFGVSVDNQCIRVRIFGELPLTHRMTLSWEA